MITEANYLDLWNLLVYEFIGSAVLFTIIGLVVIAYFALRFRIPVNATIGFLILFIGVVLSVVFNTFLWAITLFIIGIIIYSYWPKIVRD